MCGGAILAELTRSPPARGVTAAHVWPQGWVGTDDFEPAFGEFHEDPESPVALPRFRRYGLSAFDVIRIPPFFMLSDSEDEDDVMVIEEDSEPSGALPGTRRYGLSPFDVIHFSRGFDLRGFVFSTPPQTEAEDTDARMPARASADSVSKALFDALCSNDGIAYEDLESLFTADAVQSKAEAAARLRSFDDRSCRLVQRRRLRVPRQHVQRGRRAKQRPRRRGLRH